MTAAAPIIAILAGVAACGNGGPSCKDAIKQAAGHFGTGDSPEVATLIGTCEQASWPSERRACFADAKSSAALQDCLPALDVKLPLPALTPTHAIQKLVADAPGDVRALLFFSDGSEAGAIVEGYLKNLPKITVERHDRMKEAALARQYKIYREGMVVLIYGDRSDTVELDDDVEHAVRTHALRGFDDKIARDLARLTKPRPKAYFVAGHGEMTDPASAPVGTPLGHERKTSVLTRDLTAFGYEVASLGGELATDVPGDATVVMILAPAVAFTAAEQAALERYLDRGGALIYALDPTVERGLGSLEGKLGVRFNPGHLTDDHAFYAQFHSALDHRWVVTNEFAQHPTVSALARGKRALLLIDSGTLETAPAGTPPPSVTFTIRSKDSSFIDLDGNFELSPATEKRDRYNVAAAIEGPKFRALVIADANLFTDIGAQAASVMMFEPVLADSLHWLARDDGMAGIAVVSEDDQPGAAKNRLSVQADADSKELLSAELELAQRRLGRAHAAMLAAGAGERDEAARRLRRLEGDEADLRARVKP